jgi:hypothetical protein
MTLAELRELLKQWLSEIKTWYPETKQSWDDYILTDADYRDYLYPDHSGNEEARRRFEPLREDQLHIILFTNDHYYHISAGLLQDGEDTGYLGCIAQTRKPRAGETWARGNDLPDGSLTKDTWDSIVRKIVGYELVAKVKPQQDKVCTGIPEEIPGIPMPTESPSTK